MKKRFYPFEGFPLHVTGRCPSDAWPAEKLNDVWRTFSEVLREFDLHCQIRTHAFVLMSNHYHWICSADVPESEIEETLSWFHEAMAFDFEHSVQMPEILEFGDIQLPPFERAPHWTVLDHIESYRNAYAYVYRNPVVAGIVEKAEYYPYSTLPYLLGRMKRKLRFTCWDQMNLVQDPGGTLDFINGVSTSRFLV